MALSFDQRDGEIWYNGNFVPWANAKVHVLNHGLHYASSVFEGERAYGGKIFKNRAHTERLHKSAEWLNFNIPYSVEELMAIKAELIKRNNIVDGYIRPVAWRGSEMMAISAQKNTIHVAIAAWPWPSMYKAEMKEKGVRLAWAKYKRPSPETAICSSKAAGLYMICTVSKHEAEDKGYDDALMLDHRGYLAEATGANLFMVIDGALHTPLPDCFLNGLTRQTIIELAKRRNIEVVERHIMPDELAKAQEVFLTGTAAEITPVGEVEGQIFAVGPITKQLIEDYSAEVRS